MPIKNDSWGIEVGSNAIKAIRLVRSGDDVELVDYEILPFKKVLTTPDLNVEEAIKVNLNKFISKHDLRRAGVVLSVPGNMAFARFAKLPPVEPKKIPDIVRFEAVQQIPFPIDQVEWDYQVFQQADTPDVEVGIFAISKERVHKFLNNYRQFDIRIDALTLSPLAVYNAFQYETRDTDRKHGTIYMDIGTVSTDVIIVEHEGIWLRTLPIGGNNFTEALVRAFKLSFPKAEKLKREASTSKYARQIFQAMRPVFADLVQELQRSLGYYQSINRDSQLNRLVGVGSTFRLPGLLKFLKQQLQIDVVRPDGFKRLTVEGRKEADFAENAINMATAYGLALQGLGLDTVSANLLPVQILHARMWRAKQSWFAAAAGCLALGAVLAGASYYASSATYHAAYQRTNGQVEAILAQARNYKQKWDNLAQTGDPQAQIENLRQTLDYRNVISYIYQDISDAATSVKPPPALLKADYSTIMRQFRQRNQRRRIYIDTVDMVYVPSPQPPKGSTNNSPYGSMAGYDLGPGGMGPDDMGTGPGGMGLGPGGMGIGFGGIGNGTPSASNQGGLIGGTYSISTFWKPNPKAQSSMTGGLDATGLPNPNGLLNPSGLPGPSRNKSQSLVTAERIPKNLGPRIVVTITGTTPYANATGLLNRVVDALKNNTNNGRQPYQTIKVDLGKLESVRNLGNNRNHRRNTINSPYGNGGYGADINGRGANPSGSSSRSRQTLRDTDNVASLMPHNPLGKENRSKDQQFVLTWTVQLVKPSVARQREEGHPSQAPSLRQARTPHAQANQEKVRS